MKILAIETSCDETAISIIEGEGTFGSPSFSILSDETISQIKIHEKWGGVVPNLAKREHIKNLVPVLQASLEDASLSEKEKKEIPSNIQGDIKNILSREAGLAEELIFYLSSIETPPIDYIAVTYGPGLEPALWVGINFAKALSIFWEKPLIPINHMEGHIFSVLLEKKDGAYTTREIKYPALSLLISGGHTELVLIKDALSYEIIGQTRDDAVGEAFDKVARLLNLPYPGGPAISALAEKGSGKTNFNLPRPMIDSPDFDFSFSGLKTSVLYTIKKLQIFSDENKADIAKQFEDAVTDVLLLKTEKALKKYDAKTVIVGGGVSANKKIRSVFSKTFEEKYENIGLLFPEQKFSTDNAVMIAISAFLRIKASKIPEAENIIANGNLILG